MKWIKNLLIATVAALSMSGVYANEISVDEISHAARVSADPVDITNVNLFDIGSNDQSMIYAYFIWPEAFKSGLGKVALDGKSFKPENMPNNGSGVGFVFDVPLVKLSMLAGFIMLASLCFYLYRKSSGGEDDKWKRALVLLVVCFVFQPSVLKSIYGGSVVGLFSTYNWISRTHDSYMLGSKKANDENKAAYTESKTLNYYDDTDKNFIWNAFVENTTKSTLLHTNNVELGREGWFNRTSGISKASVLSNVENQVYLKPVVQNKDGVADKVNFVWNQAFENYSKRQYGPASVMFTIQSESMDSQVEDLDSDFVTDVKKMAQEDGANAFPADLVKSSLERIEETVYGMIKADDVKGAERYYDEATATIASTAMQNGLKKVYQKYKSEGLGSTDMTTLYRAYGRQFLKSANGVNPQLTVTGKWEYAQKAQSYTKIYNASRFFEKEEHNIKQIGMFNLMSGGQEWASMSTLTGSINFQWVSIIGGALKHAGVEPLEDVMTDLKNRIAASATAMNLFKSNIIQGADNGQKLFSADYNAYKNEIVSNWDKGAIMSMGLNTSALGKLMNGSALLGSTFRNTVTVSAYSEKNSVGVDLVKTFGETISKDASNDERYKYIDGAYNRVIFNELASPKQATQIQTVEQSETVTESQDAGDILINFIQNRSSVLTNFKEDTGLPYSMSISEGIRYCNQNTNECNARATGTVSGIYRPDVLELGIEMKMAAILIKALDSIDLDLEGTSFSGVVSVIKAIPVVGTLIKFLSIAIKILAVMAELISLIGSLFIFIGLWSWVLQILPTIQAIQMQAMIPLMIIESLLLLVVYALLVAFKNEPRVMILGGKSIISIWAGVYFWIMGYYVMIACIYFLPTGPMQRAVFAQFAGNGGIDGLISGLTFSYIALAMLHITYMLTMRVFMDVKAAIFQDGGNAGAIAAVVDNRTIESMVLTHMAERGIVNMSDKMLDKVAKSKGAKEFLDRLKERIYPGSTDKGKSKQNIPVNQSPTKGI
ncbi:hypothetical protein K3Z84_00565 [Pseudomonas aeruginosa]|nr:hypothetical protein [Pseudomonas aeruginosa]